MSEKKRVCKVCEEEKPLEEFPERTSGGYTYRFKTCMTCFRAAESARQRKYMEKHREAHNRRARLDRAIRYDTDPEYREKMQARSREYYHKNKEKILAKRRAKAAAE